ncbi:MAG: AraC family transcriptional regulator [Verrucomicrobia bacterium]|nr:AraC family transcriptional regulator [Verrucomicrobiota bacterium]
MLHDADSGNLFTMQKRQAWKPAVKESTGTPVMSFSFTDCDGFSDLLRHEDAEIIQTRSGRFNNHLLLAPLETTLLRYGVRSTPWIARATGNTGHVSLLLDLHYRQPVLINGRRKNGATSLTLYGDRAEHHSVVIDPGEYAYVPFPIAELEAAAQAAQLSRLPVADAGCALLTPEPRHFSHLCETVESIRWVAQQRPEVFLQEDAKSGMERSLTSALVLALSSCEREGRAIQAAERTRILRRAQDYLHDRSHQPVYMLELCAAVGAPERTVRDVFLRELGVPPMRYLKLRRLKQARALLKLGDPPTTSVKAVALTTGFWELGVDRRTKECRGVAPRDAVEQLFELIQYLGIIPQLAFQKCQRALRSVELDRQAQDIEQHHDKPDGGYDAPADGERHSLEKSEHREHHGG